MLEKCEKVCVIGAGTMGSGIAAHLANIGFSVSLLDLTLDSATSAFTRSRSLKPPHFYIDGTANTIQLGAIEENSALIAEADWVCEAIVEKPEAKQALFAQIDPLLREDALISTNTSGLEISRLAEGRSASFRQKFLGTHFFNPPRYLKLLELIPTPETAPEVIQATTRFLEHKVARRVVLAKDTPGFIANRFGMWSMFFAIHIAEKLGLSVEEVDAITGPFIGRPRSGSFRLNDLVGLDIMEDIATNLRERCPDDPETKRLANPESMDYLIEKGWIGGKVGQGYYRKEGKEFVSFDLKTHAYRERQEPQLDSIAALGKLPFADRLRAAIELRDPVGEYLREYLLPTLRYANQIKEEVSHSVQDFDRVMQWGFGWEHGPFAIIDALGAEKVGIESPKFYEGTEILGFDQQRFHRKAEPDFRALADYHVIETHKTFRVRDLGDGVHGLGLTTKLGVVSPLVVDELTSYLETGKSQRIVFSSEAPSFSVGFDLKFFLEGLERQDFAAIEASIYKFQQLGRLIGQIPSVAAVFGYCLGGGYEIALSCSHIVAAPETQIGLPESRVGLVPGGGGTPLMRLRSQSSAKHMGEMVKNLTLGTVSTCADEARNYGFLQDSDITCYHPDRLIFTAQELALTCKPRQEKEWSGASGPLTSIADSLIEPLRAQGQLSPYDLQISRKLMAIFAKSTSFEDALIRERQAFLELMNEGLTQARIKHMVETNRPLRN